MNTKDYFANINKLLSKNPHTSLSNISVNKPIIENKKYGANGHWFGDGTTTIDNKNYKFTLKIPYSVIRAGRKKNGNLEPAEYNFHCKDTHLSDYGQIVANIASIERSGLSSRDIRNQELLKFAKSKGLLKRKRKRLPSKVENILCLTSRSSDIKGDIVANTGLPAKNIYVFNCFSSQVLANKIMSAKGVDCIVLYRGGHEDDSMNMFSEQQVLLAIGNSKIPVCVALGHEQDKPFVYKVADLTYSTPSSFGKSIQLHNNQRSHKTLKTLFILWMFISLYLYFG